MTWYQFNRRS